MLCWVRLCPECPLPPGTVPYSPLVDTRPINVCTHTQSPARSSMASRQELSIPLLTVKNPIIRPRLEYCIQAWRPYRKKDIDMLERVRRRATKMIQQLRNISYEMHLKECDLTTIETRRLRGDQIELLKILYGYENIDRNYFLSMEGRRTRWHGVTLAKKQSIQDIRIFSTKNSK